MNSTYHKDILLQELHKKLQKHLEDQSRYWKSFVYAQDKGFYQGYEEIGIDGWRPTEKRFERYNIMKYLQKNKLVLDIGSNCGFLSLYVSKYVDHVAGVEINPYLVNIANDTKQYLKIENAMFHCSSFEDFKTIEKFDIIFSLANDSTIDGNTKFNFIEYIKKILSLLKNNGFLMFENQAQDQMEPSKFLPKLTILKKYFNIIEERTVQSEYPVNVPTRTFLVLRKID